MKALDVIQRNSSPAVASAPQRRESAVRVAPDADPDEAPFVGRVAAILLLPSRILTSIRSLLWRPKVTKRGKSLKPSMTARIRPRST